MQRHCERLPIVFLPAMLCDAELYDRQIAVLQERFETVVLTTAEPTMVEAAAAALRRMPPRFVLVGTSYGGSLALEVAATAPARVAGLCLMGCNPGPHGDPAGGVRLSERVATGAFTAVVEAIAAEIVCADGPRAEAAREAFRRMAQRSGPTAFLRQNASLLGRVDRRPSLAGIACPVLLLWGQQDRLADPGHGAAMAAQIPGARLQLFSDCGHLPTLERPVEAIVAMREWLAGQFG